MNLLNWLRPKTINPAPLSLKSLPSKEEQEAILKAIHEKNLAKARTALPQMRSIIAKAIEAGQVEICEDKLRFFEDWNLVYLSINLLKAELKEAGLNMKIYPGSIGCDA